MPNGTSCCALEICCNPVTARRKVADSIELFTGAEPEYCAKFLEWMDHEGLIFAPADFRRTMDTIATMAKKHTGDK